MPRFIGNVISNQNLRRFAKTSTVVTSEWRRKCELCRLATSLQRNRWLLHSRRQDNDVVSRIHDTILQRGYWTGGGGGINPISKQKVAQIPFPRLCFGQIPVPFSFFWFVIQSPSDPNLIFAVKKLPLQAQLEKSTARTWSHCGPINLCFVFLLIGPLDRGCQKLIFPACKNLGIYDHTLFSESVQKKVYKLVFNRTYGEGDLEKGFPKIIEKDLSKFPKCQANIKRMFCGELFPPCFPDERCHGRKTLCRSVCDEIARDCPGFFR